MTEKIKDFLSFFGRLALSGALLWWLFSTQVNWRDTMSAIKQADPILLWWAFVVTFAIQIVVLIRWSIFMKALNLSAPFGLVCRYFFIGLFFNFCLPTSIGGDVVKAIGLSRRIGQKPKIFASVVLDRLSGFAGIVIVALISYLVGIKLVDGPSVIIPVVVLTVLSLAVGGVLFSRRCYAIGCRIFEKIPRLHKALMDMHHDVMLMTGKKRSGFGCIIISCLIQIMGASSYYLIGLALHIKATFLHYLIFSPLVSAATFLPSIGGLGVREGGWKIFLAKVGVDPAAAVGLSLVSFFFVIICGLIGGVVYVTTFSGGRVQRDPSDPGA